MPVYPPIAELLESPPPLVGPSLLACDFSRLAEEVRHLEQAGARLLHLDVMDGHFVPNISIGPVIVEAVRRVTTLPLDVHLMISHPERYVAAFREAGADVLTVHVETVDQPGALLDEIHRLGAAAGLALNPPTPVDAVLPYLDRCDLVLVMSVMPGFGGQPFMPVALEKLQALQRANDRGILLSVDGGVNPETIGQCFLAGARLLITGTALLGHDDYPTRIDQLRKYALDATPTKTDLLD